MKDLRTKFQAFFLIFILVIAGGIIAIRSDIYIQDNTGMTDSSYNNVSWLTKDPDFIVLNNNDEYYGINCSSGLIQFHNAVYLGGADDVIQSCIDEIPDDYGGSVFIKAGHYYINSTIHLYRDYAGDWTPMSVYGAGMGATMIFQVAGSNCDMIDFNITGAGSDGFKEIHDITFQGQTADTYGNGFFNDDNGAGSDYDWFIHNCEFVDMAQDGIHCEGSWAGKIDNCIMELNNNNGTYFYNCQQTYMSNTFIAYNDWHGIYMTGNYFHFTNLDIPTSGMYGIKMASVTKSTFTGITIYGFGIDGATSSVGIFTDTSSNNSFCAIIIDGQNGLYADYGLWLGGRNNSFYGVDIIRTNNYNLRVSAGADDCLLYINYRNSTGVSGGKRNLINGVGYNSGVPGAVGNWKTYTREGAMVWNTLVSELYIYTNATWTLLYSNSIFKLTPRTTIPTGASEGWVYVNSTDHHIYCYLNGVWVQLD